MPPNFKHFAIGYSALTTVCYITSNYYEGKHSLINYRIYYANQTDMSSELNAVKQGIHSDVNLFEALYFPVTVPTKIMPTFVLFMNPKQNLPTDKNDQN